MKKKSVLILLLLLSCSYLSPAQTFEEYVRQQQKQYDSYVKEQQEGLLKLQQEYNEFVKKRNEEFARYLEKEWTNYNSFRANKPVEAPKPPDPPSYVPPKTAPVPVKIVARELPVPVPPKAEQEKPQPVPVPDRQPRRLEVPVDFFGQNLVIRADPQLINFRLGKPGQNEVGRFWRTVSVSNYGDVLLQMVMIREQLNLNDWGFYQLVNQFSARISPDNVNTRILYNWFFLTVSGYQNRIAYAESSNRLYLLVPTMNNVYGCQYLKFNGQEYYFIANAGEDVGSVQTYDSEYGDAKKRMDLYVSRPLNFSERYQNRKYRFSPDYPELSLDLPLNEMAFYATYPQTDLYVTLSAPVNPRMGLALMEYFGKLARGKSQTETVGMLLEFTQKAIPYKTDQAQFGNEKWDFPGEVFYYPFCDCDDRAALFSWLVTNIAGLEVVGILFPGHVSTAVQFPGDVPGDFVMVRQKKYTICDGTFIGAPIGRGMPQFAGKQGEIISRPGNSQEELLAGKIWDKVIQAGGYPGEGRSDATDGQGNMVVTGWFEKPFTLGKNPVSPTGGRDLFVASFNGSANLNWLKILEGSGAEYATGILRDQSGNLVVSGNFSGSLVADQKNIQGPATEQSLFLLSLKPSGSVNWLTPVSFTDLKTRANIYYQVRLTREGRFLGTEYLPQQQAGWKNLLTQDQENNLVAMGGFSSLPGMVRRTGVVNDAGNYDVAALLKQKNDQLILAGCDKGVAGLFAVFNLLSDFESKLSGEVVQQALDKYNPTFKTKSPNLYKSLRVVEFLKNSNGVVTLRTLDNQYLEFDLLKVKNETVMKMVNTPEGDARIDFISGAKVGKAFVWFPLNSITVIQKTGDLIFDYAKDHSKSCKNINKDILF